MKLINGRELVITAREWLELGKAAGLFDVPVYPGVKLTREYYSRLTPEGREIFAEHLFKTMAERLYPRDRVIGESRQDLYKKENLLPAFLRDNPDIASRGTAAEDHAADSRKWIDSAPENEFERFKQYAYEDYLERKKDDPLVRTKVSDFFNRMMGKSDPEMPQLLSPTQLDVSEIEPEIMPDPSRATPIQIPEKEPKPTLVPVKNLDDTQPLASPLERRRKRRPRVLRFQNSSTSITLTVENWERIGVAAGWLKPRTAERTGVGPLEDRFDGTPTREFAYHINLDERGTFYADVRDERNQTVYEIKIDDADPDWDSWNASIFADGFMRDKRDLDGLKDHLVELGIIDEDDVLKSAYE